MSEHARTKRIRRKQDGKGDPYKKYRWPKGHPPKAIRGQSSRSVLIVNSGIFEVTAKVVGTRDTNRFTAQLTEYHMLRHLVPETAYGAYSFRSKRAMKKWLVQWHSQGDWKAKLCDFKIEWL